MEKGKLIIYYGPMFSGKSEKMIDKMNDYDVKEIQVFKPIADLRTKTIYSRNGKEHEAINVKNSQEIFDLLLDNTKVVFIDEVNFFDEKIVDIVKKILDKGINVYASGLDLDYKLEPFGYILKLKEFADETYGLNARCEFCGKSASYTSRFINGVVDSLDSETIISETLHKTSVKYLPLCDKHHPYFKK